MNKGNGCGGCGGSHHTMHMILKVVLLALIFMCGFKLGMVTGYIGHNYERGGMMDYNYSGKMMRGNYEKSTTTTTVVPANN